MFHNTDLMEHSKTLTQHNEQFEIATDYKSKNVHAVELSEHVEILYLSSNDTKDDYLILRHFSKWEILTKHNSSWHLSVLVHPV